MPSFQDSAVIFLLALLLFGPKELPKLARYIGKLMNEFRRASSEFRMQMEDEFRQSEQAEQQ
jgi:sec-independent protein translocase protein TatB